MTKTTTRRALFTAAAAVTVAPPLASSAAPNQSPMKALWAERQRLFNTRYETDEEGDVVLDQLGAVEKAILRAQIHSRADAAVKARLAIYAMDAGKRADGADDASMLQIAEWLERG